MSGWCLERLGTVPVLSTAKLVNDAYLSFLAPILPLIAAREGLSLAAVGLVASVLSFASMVPQPLFGLIGRQRPFAFIVWGPVAVATGTAGLLMTSGYGSLLAFAVVSGLGAAAFNPAAAAVAGASSPQRRGLAIGMLTAGGTFGRAIGPVAILLLLSVVGTEGVAVAAAPGLLIAVVIYGAIPRTGHLTPAVRPKTRLRLDRLRALGLLWLLMALRAAVIGVLSVYIPTSMSLHGYPLLYGGIAVAALHVVGGLCTLIGGPLSDRFGRRPVTILSFALGVLPLVAAQYFSVVGAIAILIVGGGLLMVSLSTTVTAGQELYPSDTAVVSGVLIGFGWGAGSIAILAAGFVGDAYGVDAVLTHLYPFALVGAAATYLLPRRPYDCSGAAADRTS